MTPVGRIASKGQILHHIRFADYLQLLKLRVMSLVVFTAAVGIVLAPSAPSAGLAGIAILCIALGAGASGALNMWYDRDIDAHMARTARRPIPAGRIEPAAALRFGVLLALGSVIALVFVANTLAAALLAFTIAWYVVVYTVWLKRRSAHAVVIGGAAGALPPVVGWAAASGEVTLPALALFAIIFFWTPPHSWALALFCGGDFAKAGLPLLPIVKGQAVAKVHIFAYAMALLPIAVMPWFVGASGPIYAFAAAALGFAFAGSGWRLLRSGEDETPVRARAFFKFSIVYLFLLFVALLADHALFTMR